VQIGQVLPTNKLPITVGGWVKTLETQTRVIRTPCMRPWFKFRDLYSKHLYNPVFKLDLNDPCLEIAPSKGYGIFVNNIGSGIWKFDKYTKWSKQHKLEWTSYPFIASMGGFPKDLDLGDNVSTFLKQEANKGPLYQPKLLSSAAHPYKTKEV